MGNDKVHSPVIVEVCTGKTCGALSNIDRLGTGKDRTTVIVITIKQRDAVSQIICGSQVKIAVTVPVAADQIPRRTAGT